MSSAASDVDVYHLPRGGMIVRTSVGLVQIDDMVDCCLYDAAGVAHVGDGVEIHRIRSPAGTPAWRLVERGRTLAEVDDVEPPPPVPTRVSRIAPRTPFVPPAFGVTVLGS